METTGIGQDTCVKPLGGLPSKHKSGLFENSMNDFSHRGCPLVDKINVSIQAVARVMVDIYDPATGRNQILDFADTLEGGGFEYQSQIGDEIQA